MKATKASEAGVMPSEEDLAEVLAYNQELVRAGVMLDGVGLRLQTPCAARRIGWSRS